MLKKIISGGQTGADRAALDFAIKYKIPHGGWIPKGRLAEDGPLPKKYKLKEMTTTSYPKRIEQNAIDSDGTVIFSHGRLTGGSAYTKKMANKHNKPHLHIDLSKHEVLVASLEILTWKDENKIGTLNVAGPRASKDPKIYKVVKDVLEALWVLESSRDRILGSLQPIRPASNKDLKLPETVDEAVDRMMSVMELKDLTMLAHMQETDLVNLHFTVGMWIRNNFVYPRNDKLLQSCREVSRDKSLHFARIHMVIIRELWKRLQQTHKLKVVK
jgi:hypothetical protein